LFRSTFGPRRAGTVLAMSAVVFVAAMSARQSACADELPGLNGAPPPVVDRTEAAAPSVAATAAPNSKASADPSSPAESRSAAAPAGRGGSSLLRLPRKFEHWDIDPTLSWSFSTGSDEIPPGGGVQSIGKPAGNTLPLDLLRITGSARYRFNRRFGLAFQRIDHVGADGRTYKGKTPQYSGQSEDLEERLLATDQLDPNTVLRAGYARRWRTCCPASGAIGNENPRFHSGFFSDIAYRFGPNTVGGKPLTTSFRWEEYKHNVSIPTPSNDEGVKPTFAYTLYSNFFLLHQTKVVPYYGIEYFSTYFSYSPQMSITWRKVYGVSFKVGPDTTWRAYVKNDQTGGADATLPDSKHKSTLYLDGSYRLHR
jgi:hypothetical protein